MQGLAPSPAAQLVRHRPPDGRIFRIEPKGAEVLEKMVNQFRTAGREDEREEILKAWV